MAQEVYERRTKVRNSLDQTSLWAYLWVTVVIVNRYKRAQFTVGVTIPTQVILNYIGMLVEYKLPWESYGKPSPPWFWLYFLGSEVG